MQSEDLMIFKKITKKDPVTKCKALKQLGEVIKRKEWKVGGGEQEFQSLMAFFLYHYQRIMIYETDAQVREAAQSTFSRFLDQGMEIEHPFKIFPVWLFSFFDPSQEVAKSARDSFN